jgi:4-amino-4-deoxy-L-arabinose transferase-like glycosyltransferase
VVAGLGARDLSHPDEGRYAEIPREMAATGDWITPHLDGLGTSRSRRSSTDHRGAFELLGAGNGPARVWPALTGLLSVAWVAFVGRRLFGKPAGAFAAIVLGSGLLWVGMGHILTLDMGFSACLALFLGSVRPP